MIIGITGLSRSGKDTAAKYISEKYGFVHLDFYRDVLLKEAKKRGIKEDDKMSMSLLGDDLRAEAGMGVLAKLLLKKMEEGKDYVITGFRSPEEVDFIRNECEDDFWLIEINAAKMTRFSRKNEKDPQTMNEFFQRDMSDIYNKGLSKVLKMADIRINNDSSIEEFYENLDSLMKKIGALK